MFCGWSMFSKYILQQHNILAIIWIPPMIVPHLSRHCIYSSRAPTICQPHELLMQMYHILGAVAYISVSANASCDSLKSAREGPFLLELTEGQHVVSCYIVLCCDALCCIVCFIVLYCIVLYCRSHCISSGCKKTNIKVSGKSCWKFNEDP